MSLFTDHPTSYNLLKKYLRFLTHLSFFIIFKTSPSIISSAVNIFDFMTLFYKSIYHKLHITPPDFSKKNIKQEMCEKRILNMIHINFYKWSNIID